MADRVYHATGQVIDKETSQGLPGLSIEAWNVDPASTQPLAVTVTEEDGRFVLTFDFTQQSFGNIPDIIFKVFRNGVLLESAESAVSWNANTEEDVTILIRKIPQKRIDAKNRVTAKQFLKGADFIQQSDFMGLLQNFKDKAGTRWDVVGEVVANTFTKMDFEPLRPARNLEKEVINKDVNTVKRNLESEQIQVTVLPYNPRLNRAFLADITTIPNDLKPGQKVNIYQENGTVKYFALVKEKGSVEGIPASDENQKGELKKLEEELKASKEDSLRKDEQIIQLRQELLAIRQDQAEIKNILKSKDFEALLKTLGKQGDEEKPNP
jgi:hypothetical protein